MVVTLTVEATAVAPVTLTTLETAQVAGLTALAGVVVTAQVKLTAPVKLFAGVTVMEDVLPVVAPAATLMLPPFESANVGGGAEAVTVTPTIVVCVIAPETPVTVTA